MTDKRRDDRHLAALDLGSSKTRILISELVERGGQPQLRFAGFGEADSRGWRKGMIADLEEVTRSIQEASERAEKQAGVPVESVVVGVGGPHIQGMSASCGLTISLRARELTRDDVRRLMESAREVSLSTDREVLHVIPEEFVLDSQHRVQNPVGMRASYLAVKAHILSGSATASANVVTAVNRAGILVETTVFEAFAAAEEALTEAERELGAAVVVLGGGSAEIAAYQGGGLRLATVIPIGGDHFTNDVAVGVHTSVRDAEVIKKTLGSVLPGQNSEATSIEVPGLDGQASHYVPLRGLSEVLESRAEELLGLIRDYLRRGALERSLGAGVVLCGGGARLGGLCDLAEKILDMPVRFGLPTKIAGMPDTFDSPEYATLIGLACYGHRLWKMRAAARNRTSGNRWKNLIVGKAG